MSTPTTAVLAASGAAAPGGAAPGAAAPVGTPVPAVAVRVNLLPREVRVARQVRSAQVAVVACLAGLLVVVAAVYALGARSVATASSDLAAAQASSAALRAEQARYQQAPAVAAELEAVRGARASALAQDVEWAQLLDRVAQAAPQDAWLVGVTGSLQPVAAAAGATGATATSVATTAGGGASAAAPIGALSITGKSTSYEAVAGYLDALAVLPGVTDPYLTTSSQDDTAGRAVVSYTITASVTSDALSHRFDQEGD